MYDGNQDACLVQDLERAAKHQQYRYNLDDIEVAFAEQQRLYGRGKPTPYGQSGCTFDKPEGVGDDVSVGVNLILSCWDNKG